MTKRFYTNHEMALIHSVYPKHGANPIVKATGRTRKAIIRKANQAGIRCDAVATNRGELIKGGFGE